MADSGQKFIGRNRAPRVQIEYDVEIGNATQKKELPFVMAVLADLSAANEEKPELSERAFVQVDQGNINDVMKSVRPTASFQVPNTLTGEGMLDISLSFEDMADFSPAAVASRVDGLKDLLSARNELKNLRSYMDGKSDAKKLIEQLLHDPELIKSLAATAKQESDGNPDDSDNSNSES